jgi:hypothetical protein
MGADDEDWPGLRRAMDRLRSWFGSPTAPSAPRDADAALRALGDIGLVRRALDEAELAAVRAARSAGRSWAEIATKLGVTRQSAWERWRDLDEPGPAPAPAVASLPSVSELVDEGARQYRRRSKVTVPDVVGRSLDEARTVLVGHGLVPGSSDPDGPPVTATGWPRTVVTDQSPEAGARVPSGSTVTLWLDRGGGSGVREPRRPKPSPLSAREYAPEPTDEAVG